MVWVETRGKQPADLKGIALLQLRVVLERTIASRPTPWGLLATFGALLQTQQAAIAAILAKLPDERGSAEFTAVIGDLAARASATPAAATVGAANAPPPANNA